MIPKFPDSSVDKELFIKGINLFKRAIDKGINKKDYVIYYNILLPNVSVGLNLIRRATNFDYVKLNEENIEKLANKVGVSKSYIRNLRNLRNKLVHLFEDPNTKYYEDFDFEETNIMYEEILVLIEEVEKICGIKLNLQTLGH